MKKNNRECPRCPASIIADAARRYVTAQIEWKAKATTKACNKFFSAKEALYKAVGKGGDV